MPEPRATYNSTHWLPRWMNSRHASQHRQDQASERPYIFLHPGVKGTHELDKRTSVAAGERDQSDNSTEPISGLGQHLGHYIQHP